MKTTLEAGYQFSENLELSYEQWFNNNIYSPEESSTSDFSSRGNEPAPIEGESLYTTDGSFKLKLSNLWRSSDKKTSVSYEGRIFLPTHPLKREAGMLTAVRNLFKVERQLFTPALSVNAAVAPMFHVYQQSGSVADSGPAANPWFENDFIVGCTVKLLPKLTFNFPIFFDVTRFRGYEQGARYDNSWVYNL